MTNPFVYGEVVPAISVVERESELERLTRDLLAGQKIFLISPRRYGKSSLVRQALRAAERGGAPTVEVTVSSYSSYVAFLEGAGRGAPAGAPGPTGASTSGAPGCGRCWAACARRSGSNPTIAAAASSRSRFLPP